MKKLLKILLIPFLFLSCYIIYKITDNHKIYYVAIGNDSSFNDNIINNNIEYNDIYTDDNYRIIDLVNIIKYNEEKEVSIHYLLNKADILIINIGNYELYSKLNDNKRNIYSYLNSMVNDMNELLSEISKYNYDKVYVLGLYNINKDNNDIFTYINYKMSSLVNSYNYNYIELNKVITKYDLIKTDDYKLNKDGINKISNELIKNSIIN